MNPSTLFIVYTVFASLLTVFVLYKNFRFLLWKKTYGTVVKSKPKRVESIVSYPTYEPDIEYVYTVNGENYKSDKLFIVDFQSDINTVEKVIKEFEEGKRITVYYNPFNPTEAILKKTINAGMFVQLLALVGIMLPFLFQSFVETEILSLNLQELANILKDWLHKTLE